MGISLILATDGITAPLSGIGRYALELARGLGTHQDIARLRCFAHANWMPAPDPARLDGHAAPAERRSLRAALAANRAAVRFYLGVMPAIAGWRLRAEGDSLFHSPNYALPPFPGISIATVHDLSHILYPRFHPEARVDYMKMTFPETLRRADHLITDAESVRHELIQQLGWPADRVTAVPLGVDPVFRPYAPEDLDPVMRKFGLEAGTYSLCVGTIEPRKNLGRLLSAYEALAPRLRRSFPLVLAGAEGWQSADIHARIGKAEREGWLRYLAFVSQPELPRLYAGARLFVYPSLYEGFGLPVLEAMASGTPVITSNRASLPEVAGTTGRMVDPEDVDQIAGALADVLQDDGWRRSAAAAGMARAALFTWPECVNRTVAVYRKVMARTQAEPSFADRVAPDLPARQAQE